MIETNHVDSGMMSRPFRLGGVRVEPSRFRIIRDDKAWPVEPRVMEVLIYLTHIRGRAVPKDELRREVWKTHVVDDAVHRAISRLRAVLGDNSEEPRLIETVPRHGYRLMTEPVFAPDRKLPLATGAIVVVTVLILSGAGALHSYAPDQRGEMSGQSHPALAIPTLPVSSAVPPTPLDERSASPPRVTRRGGPTNSPPAVEQMGEQNVVLPDPALLQAPVASPSRETSQAAIAPPAPNADNH